MKWYDTTTKLVVPSEQFTEISCSLQGANEMWRLAPTSMANIANGNTFFNAANAAVSTWNFFYYLGYQCAGGTIGQDGRYMDAGGSAAILAGLGEASRQKLYTLTPEYGAPGRLYSFGTDLPIAPNKPIDAGMYRFCHACHKCANHCPPGSDLTGNGSFLGYSIDKWQSLEFYYSGAPRLSTRTPRSVRFTELSRAVPASYAGPIAPSL